MATRIQVRRGTTSQWNTANPTLEEGEIGYNSTLGQIKIGDGTSVWADLDYFVSDTSLGTSLGTYVQDSDKSAINGVAELDASKNILAPASIIFEGTANDHETTLAVTDPTADRTITFPDATGTVALTTDISVTAASTTTFSNKSISLGSNTVTSTLAQLNTAISDADVATLAGTETLTNKTLTSPVINTPTGITKTDVGLANVDNTSDANKPVSTATQTALDLKANLANPTFTGTVNAAALTLSGDLTVNGTTTTVNSTTVNVSNAFVFEGTANDFETTLTITDPTADRTITLPDSTGTVALTSDITVTPSSTNTLTNKTLTSPKINEDVAVTATATELNYVDGVTSAIQTQLDGKVDESLFDAKGDILVASADNTPAKLGVGTNGYILTANSGATNGVEWAAAPISLPSQTGNSGKYLTTDGSTASWGTVSSYSAPTIGSTSIASGATVTTIAGLTLTTPVISSISNTGTLTLPTSTDTLVGRATTDTLTNKSISLTTNTVTGTIAEFNSAVTDQDLATLAGTETLTNKTLGSAVATTALTLNATAELRLADTDSTHYVGFKAPGTVTTNRIWTLPSADGTSGQTLSTNGSGTLSFSTPSAGAAFSEFMLIGC
jgi:hypothetical protein